ncbi:MAG: hypothetical protein FI707_13265 [SAR202 cluster bacterium]|nr:hypothetical protein [SAR202 cluster bacterium]MQG69747.1 hypothetical protein [SAR202 cluster bacterium]HAL47798.1 hypothetical protein [Dehalococcoidia bacterium]
MPALIALSPTLYPWRLAVNSCLGAGTCAYMDEVCAAALYDAFDGRRRR